MSKENDKFSTTEALPQNAENDSTNIHDKKNFGFGTAKIIVAIFLLLVLVTGCFITAATLKISVRLGEAEECVRENRGSDALNLCFEAFYTEKNPNKALRHVLTDISPYIPDWRRGMVKKRAKQIIVEAYVHEKSKPPYNCADFMKLMEEYSSSHYGNTDFKEIYDEIKALNALSQEIENCLHGFHSYTQAIDPDISIRISAEDHAEIFKYLDSVPAETKEQQSIVEFYRLDVDYWTCKDNNDAVAAIENVSFCKFCSS